MAEFVEIHPEQIRSHYASMSDEALLALDRNDLTDIGRQFYDVEIASRKLEIQPPDRKRDETTFAVNAINPDWMNPVCVFEQLSRGAADSAATVVDALNKARIPCNLILEHVEPEPTVPYDVYRVMVPAHLELVAASVVDRDVFNTDTELKWRAHFAEVNDAELIAMDPDLLFGALLDRVERVKRAYREELIRRNLVRR